jgi:hypothetical protein
LHFSKAHGVIFTQRSGFNRCARFVTHRRTAEEDVVLSRYSLAALFTLLLPAVAVAQGGGGGIGNNGASSNVLGSGAPPEQGPRPLTPAETFMSRLKLDEKTQVPQAMEILSAAAREAAPLGTQLLQICQQQLNAEMSKQPEAIAQANAAYATAAGKLASIEAQAFAKIYAMLKPNQTSKANEAFELLPVILTPAAPVRGGSGGRGRGGAR